MRSSAPQEQACAAASRPSMEWSGPIVKATAAGPEPCDSRVRSPAAQSAASSRATSFFDPELDAPSSTATQPVPVPGQQPRSRDRAEQPHASASHSACQSADSASEHSGSRAVATAAAGSSSSRPPQLVSGSNIVRASASPARSPLGSIHKSVSTHGSSRKCAVDNLAEKEAQVAQNAMRYDADAPVPRHTRNTGAASDGSETGVTEIAGRRTVSAAPGAFAHFSSGTPEASAVPRSNTCRPDMLSPWAAAGYVRRSAHGNARAQVWCDDLYASRIDSIPEANTICSQGTNTVRSQGANNVRSQGANSVRTGVRGRLSHASNFLKHGLSRSSMDSRGSMDAHTRERIRCEKFGASL